MTVTVSRQSQSAEQTFLIRLNKRSNVPDPEPTDFAFDQGFANGLVQDNPFETGEELTPRGKIDEFVFAKLKELEIEPSNPCSDGAFLRRVFFDTMGTLPTAEEARRFLENENPDKRAELIEDGYILAEESGKLVATEAEPVSEYSHFVYPPAPSS